MAVVTARDIYDRAREAGAASRSDLNASRAREQSIREETGPSTGLTLAEVEEAVAVCSAELEELVCRADVSSLEEKIPGAESAATEAESAARTAADTLATEEKALAGAEARLNERAAGIPEDMRVHGSSGGRTRARTREAEGA